MAFLRVLQIKGHDYAYILESYRNSEGKPRQRIVEYLGPVEPIYRRHGKADIQAVQRRLQKAGESLRRSGRREVIS